MMKFIPEQSNQPGQERDLIRVSNSNCQKKGTRRAAAGIAGRGVIIAKVSDDTIIMKKTFLSDMKTETSIQAVSRSVRTAGCRVTVRKDSISQKPKGPQLGMRAAEYNLA